VGRLQGPPLGQEPLFDWGGGYPLFIIYAFILHSWFRGRWHHANSGTPCCEATLNTFRHLLTRTSILLLFRSTKPAPASCVFLVLCTTLYNKQNCSYF